MRRDILAALLGLQLPSVLGKVLQKTAFQITRMYQHLQGLHFSPSQGQISVVPLTVILTN